VVGRVGGWGGVEVCKWVDEWVDEGMGGELVGDEMGEWVGDVTPFVNL